IYELLEHRDYPCFTIMMPTHRMPPARETDPLQFKNLVSELANKIRANGLDQHLDMIEELHQMENDRDFWNHQERGLAIFIAPAYTQVVKVPVTLPSLTIVSDSF